MKGTYCGPLVQLTGETALLQEVPGSDNVKAQFDNLELPDHNGKDLAFGWHLFLKAHFLIDPPVNWED